MASDGYQDEKGYQPYPEELQTGTEPVSQEPQAPEPFFAEPTAESSRASMEAPAASAVADTAGSEVGV